MLGVVFRWLAGIVYDIGLKPFACICKLNNIGRHFCVLDSRNVF